MKQASLLKTLQQVAGGVRYAKQGSEKFEVDGHHFFVDTCYVGDVECYETCVFKDHDGGTNVQHYDTAEAATAGHIEWVKAIKANPNIHLPEQNEYGL